MRLVGGLLALGLLLGACSDAGESDPEAADRPSETASEGSAAGPRTAEDCFEPALEALQVLAGGITAEGATLGVNAIPAEDADDLWYLAGELEGGDFDGDGDIAVWATTEDPSGEAFDFIAVNDLAIEESDWEPEADIDGNDPAVDVVTKCVEKGIGS
jgi:hypothetical protein